MSAPFARSNSGMHQDDSPLTRPSSMIWSPSAMRPARPMASATRPTTPGKRRRVPPIVSVVAVSTKPRAFSRSLRSKANADSRPSRRWRGVVGDVRCQFGVKTVERLLEKRGVSCQQRQLRKAVGESEAKRQRMSGTFGRFHAAQRGLDGLLRIPLHPQQAGAGKIRRHGLVELEPRRADAFGRDRTPLQGLVGVKARLRQIPRP